MQMSFGGNVPHFHLWHLAFGISFTLVLHILFRYCCTYTALLHTNGQLRIKLDIWIFGYYWHRISRGMWNPVVKWDWDPTFRRP